MVRLHTAVISPAEFGRETSPDGRYYTTYKDNIFGGRMSDEHLRQFQHGDGNELYGKACAVASSSMLAYNFFHWINKKHPLTLNIDGNPIVFDGVAFERKFPCIIGRKCANMDVVLTSSKSKIMLCIESKFTEHLETSKFEIADAYRHKKNNIAEIDWLDIISLTESLCDIEDKWYKSGLKQNISHLVALYNFVIKPDESVTKSTEWLKEYKDYKTVHFRNVLFEPSKEFEIDYKLFNAYTQVLDKLQEEVCKRLDAVKLSKHLTYLDIYNAILNSNAPEGLKEFLIRRYMEYHEGFKSDIS